MFPTVITTTINNKGDKIKRNVIRQNYGNGGLRMIDISSFNKALKSVWIRKYLDESNKGKWKLFFDAELEKLEGQTVFRGNLDIKDSKKLANNLSPFLKDILEKWSELNYQLRFNGNGRVLPRTKPVVQFFD